MPYNVNKSDPTSTTPIVVPDMPPGLNTVDTSLKLIGRNYPNFGQALAENFVHLLENFSSPVPPGNPISGQLWYDTSLLDSQILKVFDGTTWFPANGVHKQEFRPASAKFGDIWVDTKNLQLYILQGTSDPILVGPLLGSTSKTGPYPEQVLDVTGTLQYVILMYINGDVIEILSTSAFTPAVVIDGFTNIVPGVNVSSKIFNTYTPKVNGITNTALNLRQTFPTVEDVSGNNFVRNDINQSINGSLWINNNNGLSFGQTTSTIKLTYSGGTAKFENIVQGGDFKFIVNNNNLQYTALQVLGQGDGTSLIKTRIQIGQSLQKSLVDVYGQTKLHGRLFVNQDNADATGPSLRVFGDAQVRSLTATQYLSANTATFQSITVGDPANVYTNNAYIVPATTGTIDIGTQTIPFGRIWANQIGNLNGTTIINGILQGPAAYLRYPTQISVTGRGINSSVISITSTGSSLNAVISMTVTNAFVFGGSTASLAISNYIHPIADALPFATTSSSQLKQISKSVLLADLYDGRIKNLSVIGNTNPYTDIVQPGTIILWPEVNDDLTAPYLNTDDPSDPVNFHLPMPNGWVYCNGREYYQSKAQYTRLYSVIGTKFGSTSPSTGAFKVPNIPDVWISDSAGAPLPTTVYTGVTGSSSTGTGATFNVEVNNNKYTASLTDGGINYCLTEMITILGTDVGGLAPDNNISVTVISTGTGATITSYSYVGNPAYPSGVQTRRGKYLIKL